ncbi:hypothetical protein BH11PSE2_BH11PSE2_01450 [soil metagenome]
MTASAALTFVLTLALLQPPAPPAAVPSARPPASDEIVNTGPPTTDVDAQSTAKEISPLDPAQGEEVLPKSIADILAGAPKPTSEPPTPAATPDSAAQLVDAAASPPAAAAGPPTPTDNIPTPPVEAAAPAISEPPALLPQPPAGPAPVRVATEGAPTFVDDPLVAPDGPLNDRDIAYQNRVLGNFQAVQGQQGPLDGRWTVTSLGGADLITLQISDPGAGEARLEGAWRDLRRSGPKASGFIETIYRADDSALVFQFVEGDPEQPSFLRLTSAQGAQWTGEAVLGGPPVPVTMRRTAGLELAAMAAPPVELQPDPPRSRAKARPAPKRCRAKKCPAASSRQRGHATAKSRSPSKQSSASKPKKPTLRR